MKISQPLLKLKNSAKKIIQLLNSKCVYKRSPFYIEEIDTKSNTVILRYRGKRTIIKATLSSTASDNKIISGLHPKQACLIGGYYGRALKSSNITKEELFKAKKMPYSLSFSHGKYKIVFLGRCGKISYVDTTTNKEFFEHPLAIANHDHLISDFDPSQACYIGLLAGLSMEKAISFTDSDKVRTNLDRLSKERPALRAVK